MLSLVNRALSTCGKIVNYLRKDAGKKCVRLCTAIAQTIASAWSAWINNYFTHTVYTVILPTLSTYKNNEIASVVSMVLPTFHSTYYSYYQFVRKDI
jgi:hypothetical protein